MTWKKIGKGCKNRNTFYINIFYGLKVIDIVIKKMKSEKKKSETKCKNSS